VKFTERREYLYDPELFGRADTQTALKIHAEYIKAHSARPYPKFMEVDRRSANVDPLWHVPLSGRTVFSRTLNLPALVQSERPDWRLTRVGLVPQQKHKIWLANLHLAEADWFPMRGDMAYWNGYRNIVVNVVMDPSAYWQQTNVWLGLCLETVIPADGDARPILNMGDTVPAENSQTLPLPEV
jgi:hypothetical protein